MEIRKTTKEHRSNFKTYRKSGNQKKENIKKLTRILKKQNQTKLIREFQKIRKTIKSHLRAPS